MSRSVPTDFPTALVDDVVRPIFLLDIAFDDITVFYCSADTDVVFGGNTYQGLGMIASSTTVHEGTSLQAESVQISVNGLPTGGWINIALTEFVQGRIANINLALFDSNWQIIDTPMLLVKGTLDTMDIAVGVSSTVTISIQNLLTDWERPDNSLFTDQEQKTRFPGDTFFDQVNLMINAQIQFGPV